MNEVSYVLTKKFKPINYFFAFRGFSYSLVKAVVFMLRRQMLLLVDLPAREEELVYAQQVFFLGVSHAVDGIVSLGVGVEISIVSNKHIIDKL